MAKSTIISVPFYTLELSKEEAQALATVLAQVGGDCMTTQRKYISQITQVLGTMEIFYENGQGYGGFTFEK